MVRYYNSEAIRMICTGAAVLGSGGGGSYAVSLKLIEQAFKPKPGAEVTVVDVGEIDKHGWLCVCADMGDPEAVFAKVKSRVLCKS